MRKFLEVSSYLLRHLFRTGKEDEQPLRFFKYSESLRAKGEREREEKEKEERDKDFFLTLEPQRKTVFQHDKF